MSIVIYTLVNAKNHTVTTHPPSRPYPYPPPAVHACQAPGD